MRQNLLVIIVENQQSLRNELKKMLETRYHIKVIGEAENTEQALNLFEEIKNFDIAFLSIQLGESAIERRAGLDLAHKLNQRDNPPWLIFTSGHEGDVLAALKEHPVDFLVKPINPTELQIAINYVLSKKPQTPDYSDDIDDTRVEINHYTFKLDRYGEKDKEKCRDWIKPSQIVYVRKNQNANSVHIKLKNGVVLDGVNGTVTGWKAILKQPYFEQIHRGHFVNLKYVQSIKRHPFQKEGFELHFKCWDDPLPIGDSYYDGLDEKIIMWKED